jgi:hypothetical protein
MEGFRFVTPVTGLKRPNTGKEDDDDELQYRNNLYIYKSESVSVCMFKINSLTP